MPGRGPVIGICLDHQQLHRPRNRCRLIRRAGKKVSPHGATRAKAFENSEKAPSAAPPTALDTEPPRARPPHPDGINEPLKRAKVVVFRPFSALTWRSRAQKVDPDAPPSIARPWTAPRRMLDTATSPLMIFNETLMPRFRSQAPASRGKHTCSPPKTIRCPRKPLPFRPPEATFARLGLRVPALRPLSAVRTCGQVPRFRPPFHAAHVAHDACEALCSS